MEKELRSERWSNPYPPHPAALGGILTREGYRLSQWSAAPGAIYPIRRTTAAVTYWVVEGALEVEVQMIGSVMLKAGDRTYVPAGSYFSARIVGGDATFFLLGEKM